jgi:4-hydroxy-2-oxoheptanedioate aldolase
MRYPPRGRRGVARALARASDFGRNGCYLDHADRELCLIVMLETSAALQQCDDILSVDGVDGVFFGAADLAADMGKRGRPNAAEVRAAIDRAIVQTRALGKAAGAFASDEAAARRLIALGASFFSVSADVSLLARGADAALRRFAAFESP